MNEKIVVLVSLFMLAGGMLSAVSSATAKPDCNKYIEYVCGLCGANSETCSNTKQKMQMEGMRNDACHRMYQHFSTQDQSTVKTYLCR